MLRFAFSRCHTVSEVCSVISKKFFNYQNSDLTSDNYRVWYVSPFELPDAVAMSHQKSRLGHYTRTGANNCTPENDTDVQNTSSSPIKRLFLIPIDLKLVGNQPLARFLVEQGPSVQHCKELSDPWDRCSRSFEFVIEGQVQYLSWPLGQRPSDGMSELLIPL